MKLVYFAIRFQVIIAQTIDLRSMKQRLVNNQIKQSCNTGITISYIEMRKI